MNYGNLREQWLADENAVFKGWDFSYLNGRWSNEVEKWDYSKIIHTYLENEHVLLDMGTSGGEFLLTLKHPYHVTHVTEAYQPNVDLCMKNLAPLGINVKQVYDDSYYRHEAFDMSEVRRILKPKGVFITQQVGCENSIDLRKSINPAFNNPFSNHNLANNIELIKKQGFDILLQEEDFPKTCFFDIGAIVYYAKTIVWEFPDFSVENCFSGLCELQKQLDEKGVIDSCSHRFIIVAKKL